MVQCLKINECSGVRKERAERRGIGFEWEGLILITGEISFLNARMT